jgi:hypothetical protein
MFTKIMYTLWKKFYNRYKIENDGKIIIRSRTNINSFVVYLLKEKKIFPIFFFSGELDLPMTGEEFLTKSNALYIEAFPSSELLQGVERLIRHLVAHQIPIGTFRII